jgi:hypothetical protein
MKILFFIILFSLTAVLLFGCTPWYTYCQGGQTICAGPYAPLPWFPS